MKNSSLVLSCILFSITVLAQVTVYNNGADITVTAGANTVFINGSYYNYDNGVGPGLDGTIDNDATIQLNGNWINNGRNSGNVFINHDGTGTVLFQGTAAQRIRGKQFTDFENVQFNNSAAAPAIFFDTIVQVRNLTTLTDGIISQSSSDDEFRIGATGATGTVTRGGGCGNTDCFVYGATVRKYFPNTTIALDGDNTDDQTLYPLGGTDGSGTYDYRPFYLGISSAVGAVSEVAVDHTETYPSWHIPVNYVDETWGGGTTVQGVSNSTWDVTTTAGGGEFVLRLGGTGFDQVGDFNDLNLTTLTTEYGTYGVPTNSSNSPNAYVEVNRTAVDDANLTNSFRIGTKDKGNSPLPVELLYFDARLNDRVVDLLWRTETELNNAYFEVEKTVDGINYEKVVYVPGAGNSTSPIDYYDIDPNPYYGTSYYRLKTVDFNGQFTYSQLEPINLQKIDLINIYPNPVDDEFAYIVGSTEEKDLSLFVYDARGRIVYSGETHVNQGVNKGKVKVGDLAPGNYLLRLITSDGIYHTQKSFVKK